MPAASSTSMIAASLRAWKLLPRHDCRRAESSSLRTTGTGPGAGFGARSPDTGSGRSSSTASHRRNRRTARNWLLAYAALYSPSSRTVHLLPPGLIRLLDQVRRREPAHRLGIGVQGPPGLALGGQVQPERAHLGLERARFQLLRMRRAPPPAAASFTL